MKYKKLTFTRMAYLTILSLLPVKKKSMGKITFPEKVGDYRFESVMDITSYTKNYFARYRGINGKKAFAKLSPFSANRYEHALLKNEKFLSEYMYDLIEKMPQEEGKIRIVAPKVLGYRQRKHDFTLLYEFVNGSDYDSQSIPNKRKILRSIFFFLDELGVSLTNEAIRYFPKRRRMQMLALYFYSFVKSIVRYPKFTPVLIKSINPVLVSMLRDREWGSLALAHKDIHRKNFIVKKGSITLFDYSNIALAPFGYDKVFSTISFWEDTVSREELISIVESEVARGMSERYFNALLWIIVIQGMGDSVVKEKIIAIAKVVAEEKIFRKREVFLKKSTSNYFIHLNWKEKIGVFGKLLVNFNFDKGAKVFPQKIGQYAFVQNIDAVKMRPYLKGIYKGAGGNRVVAKIYSGRKSSIHYTNLIREAKVMEMLSSQSIINTKVQSPKFMGVYESENSLVLFTELNSGRVLKKSVPLGKFSLIFKSAVNYMKVNTPPPGVQNILDRDKKYYLTTMLVLFLPVLILNMKSWRILIPSFNAFLRGITDTKRLGEKVLIHGDIHPENLAHTKSGYMLFDFEQSQKTFQVVEYATALCSARNSIQFCQYLMSEIDEYIHKNQISRNGAVALIIFIAIQNLIGVSTFEAKKRALEVLAFAMQLKGKKSYSKNCSFVGI